MQYPQSSTIVEPSSFCGLSSFCYYIGSVGKHYIKQQILKSKIGLKRVLPFVVNHNIKLPSCLQLGSAEMLWLPILPDKVLEGSTRVELCGYAYVLLLAAELDSAWGR